MGRNIRMLYIQCMHFNFTLRSQHYGKHPGGVINHKANVVTASRTNRLEGGSFFFLLFFFRRCGYLFYSNLITSATLPWSVFSQCCQAIRLHVCSMYREAHISDCHCPGNIMSSDRVRPHTLGTQPENRIFWKTGQTQKC